MHGGQKMRDSLFMLVQNIWVTETVPQDWIGTSIIPLFKKSDRKESGNYWSIPLLSIVGKILSPHTIESAKCTYYSRGATGILVWFQYNQLGFLLEASTRKVYMTKYATLNSIF